KARANHLFRHCQRPSFPSSHNSKLHDSWARNTLPCAATATAVTAKWRSALEILASSITIFSASRMATGISPIAIWENGGGRIGKFPNTSPIAAWRAGDGAPYLQRQFQGSDARVLRGFLCPHA